MNAIDVCILNLEETRRRSHKLWRSLPDEWLGWRPDQGAFSFGEMIRHVWRASYNYHRILLHGGSPINAGDPPFDQQPIQSVEGEIALSQPYFQEFLTYVRSLSESDLNSILIKREDAGYERHLGDMILRIAYHDSVHTGQFLQYLRMAGLERPRIWD
ncbi:DinB family protein [Mechercharimyces sp. CAU 1602]|uniref:DinB family protein n=1 Tax=Mechercharimyces sp. CAU 1602 TaxID=2973933 RepID=UPI002162C97F|nr:DinB family protein [Mechercharimyces sp. CAU 1602]MCS1351444.1 DinB family protein [Mechercharimyces sp. CAU 1602]